MLQPHTSGSIPQASHGMSMPESRDSRGLSRSSSIRRAATAVLGLRTVLELECSEGEKKERLRRREGSELECRFLEKLGVWPGKLDGERSVRSSCDMVSSLFLALGTGERNDASGMTPVVG